MSPRRKSGLSPEDLQALKHLPAVLRALEHLRAQDAKVRALMGPPIETLDPATRAALIDVAKRTARLDALTGSSSSMPFSDVSGAFGSGLAPGALTHIEPRNPTLDTPERREYEEARRAGLKVPAVDPFANASPAQRERMAEQRAFLKSQGRRPVGLPSPDSHEELAEAVFGPPPPPESEPVRTETLDTISDGNTPLADDADEEIH